MVILAKLEKFRNFGLLLMRAGLGCLMIKHGFPKLEGGVDTWTKLGNSMGNLGIHFMPAVWGFLAAFSEAIGGLLSVLGLWFRPACLLIIFTMIVAALHHFSKGDGLDGAGHALEIAFAYLGLLFLGPGTFSVDKK